MLSNESCWQNRELQYALEHCVQLRCVLCGVGLSFFCRFCAITMPSWEFQALPTNSKTRSSKSAATTIRLGA